VNAATEGRRLDALLAHLNLAVLAEDEHRHIQFANQAFCDLFGIPAPPEALLGMDCAAMADDSAAAFREPDAFLASVDRALSARVEEQGVRFQLADGRWVERDYVPVFAAEVYQGHLWVYREVTAKVEADEAVRGAKANLEAIVENARDPIWSVDRRLRLVNFNSAFVRLAVRRAGWRPVVGAPVVQSIGADSDREMARYAEALRGASVDFELAVPPQDGDEGRILEVHLAPFLVGSEVLGVTAATRDITRSRRATQLLRDAKDAAEDANRAKSDFLAHISHEIRTPLNAVMGMVDLALDTSLDQRQRSYLTTAQHNSEALLSLISDILDFSKIEAGEMDLEHAPFAPREVVEEVVGFLALAAEQKGLDLTFEAAGVPDQVAGDRHRYRQVAMNLVGNAIKYTEQGFVHVALQGDADGQLELAVADSGVGIAPDDQARIFSRFFRSRGSERTSGTGLGLAITARLVELMNGEVAVSSELGHGSTFRVVLPMAALPAEAPAELVGRALVASPHADERARWVDLLGELGLSAEALSDGAALLDVVLRAEQGYDALLVSADLPGPALSAIASVVGGLPACEASRWLVVARSGDPVVDVPDATVLHRPLLRTSVARALAGPAEARTDLRRGARVLVAEDHADSRTMMLTVLRRAGHDAHAVADGLEAQRELLSGGYDLALLDLDMPLVDGVAVAEAVRSQEARSGQDPMPLVMVSGHATEDHRRRAQAAGVDAFVPKPVNRQRLLEVVDRVLDLRPLVLVADDAGDGRRLLRSWLTSAGARVIEAVNGEGAVQQAQAHQPDLIVLDMLMPVLDGHGAARRLRRLPDHLATPILGLTGRTGREARREVLKSGCTAYLAKPCSREQLLTEARKLLWHGTELDDGAFVTPVPAARIPERRAPTDEQDDDGLADLVPLYLEERASDLTLADAAVTAGDWETVRQLGHRMKGTAVPYGFPEIGELGARLEDAARAEDRQVARAAVERLGQVLREARTTSRGSTRP